MTENGRGQPGSLIVVGTGIRTVGQLTVEAIAWMRRADKILYVIGDPIAEAAIAELNQDNAESLSVLYGEGKPRLQTYNEMVERILECVRAGMTSSVEPKAVKLPVGVGASWFSVSLRCTEASK